MAHRWLIISGRIYDFLLEPEDELFFFALPTRKESFTEKIVKGNFPNKLEIHEIPTIECSHEYELSSLRSNDRELVSIGLNESAFQTQLNDLKIDFFYSITSFYPFMEQIRKILLSDNYFHQILPLWNADLLLGEIHMDWMGTLNKSTTAKMKIDQIPELNNDQEEYLDCFMTKFLHKKINPNKKCFQSSDEVRDTFKTNKPIAVILAQVIGDTALVAVGKEKIYYDYTWIPNFIEKHQDVFFIIKDHPSQHKIFKNHAQVNFWGKQKGKNWYYLPPDSEYDTLGLSMHADFIVTVNSRAGFDAMYWTSVVAGGDRYRHKEICHYFEDFKSDIRPPKRSDILKFMYYVITRSLFLPGEKGTKKQFNQWREWTNKYRLSVGASQNNLQQASIEELDQVFAV